MKKKFSHSRSWALFTIKKKCSFKYESGLLSQIKLEVTCDVTAIEPRFCTEQNVTKNVTSLIVVLGNDFITIKNNSVTS